MSPEEILDRLENVRRRWGYYSARCPAHEDRRNSLSYNPGKWLRCHAGCTWKEIMEALSEDGVDDVRVGTMSSTYDDRVPGKSRPSLAPLSESALRPADISLFPVVYDYRDGEGNLLYKVCRSWEKDFFQCHPSPDSPTGYFWGLGGRKPILYRLERLRRAVEAAQTVYVVEGEKDVHAVEKAGGIATCCPMGAGKWRDHYNEEFEGAYVVIVRDMDKAGLAHAEDVLERLSMYAEDIRLVAPRVGKDAHDHLKTGEFGLDDFVELEPSVY